MGVGLTVGVTVGVAVGVIVKVGGVEEMEESADVTSEKAVVETFGIAEVFVVGKDILNETRSSYIIRTK